MHLEVLFAKCRPFCLGLNVLSSFTCGLCIYKMHGFHTMPQQSRQSREFPKPRWLHQLKTFSALLALCVGNSPVTGEFPSQRPVTRSFDVFLDLGLNERLSKQSWAWWFETPSHPIWCHSNALHGGMVYIYLYILQTPLIYLTTWYSNPKEKTRQYLLNFPKYQLSSNRSCTLVGNKIVDHSYVVGAEPVSAAAITSSLST